MKIEREPAVTVVQDVADMSPGTVFLAMHGEVMMRTSIATEAGAIVSLEDGEAYHVGEILGPRQVVSAKVVLARDPT